MKCSKCGLEVTEKTEEFLLHQVKWGGDKKYCQCHNNDPNPEEEQTQNKGAEQ